MGHPISHSVVANILHFLQYSLQGTRKTLEGRQHPDRDDQFRYINTLAQELLASGDPVISVDTKKKELVGRYTQAGKEWHPKGEPVDVSTYDFPSQADGKAIPYGVYDVTDNSAWVSVGIDHDTSVFAVATIEKWWEQMGKKKYPNARRILITADGGGSNGHRPWLWKFQLARLAATTGLEIIVCHYPPGTSKWNKIEHRSSPESPTTGADDRSRHTKPSSTSSPTPQPPQDWPSAANSIPTSTQPKSKSPTNRSNPYPSPDTCSTTTGITPSHHRVDR